MEKVLLSSNRILSTPSPSAAIAGVEKDAIDIELSFRVQDLGKVSGARNEIYDLVYRHAAAAGLELAPAAGTINVDYGRENQSISAPRLSTPMRLVSTIPLFAGLTDEEKDGLATSMSRLTFKKGEVISHRDTALTSLLILRSGVAVVEEFVERHGSIELGRHAPGDYFEERGVLLGALELADVRALTPVIIYEITKERLATILRDRPVFAEELAQLISNRTRAEEQVHLKLIPDAAPHGSAFSLRIKKFFTFALRLDQAYTLSGV